MERTLIILKPDAIQRALVGKIINMFEEKGLKIVGLKMIRMDKERVRQHYAHLVDKPFFPSLEEYMSTHPVIVMVLEGKDVVSTVRKFVGVTNSREAEPGTIRGKFSMSVSRNIVHASENKEIAEKEIRRFFREEEIFDYELALKRFLYAEDEI